MRMTLSRTKRILPAAPTVSAAASAWTAASVCRSCRSVRAYHRRRCRGRLSCGLLLYAVFRRLRLCNRRPFGCYAAGYRLRRGLCRIGRYLRLRSGCRCFRLRLAACASVASRPPMLQSVPQLPAAQATHLRLRRGRRFRLRPRSTEAVPLRSAPPGCATRQRIAAAASPFRRRSSTHSRPLRSCWYSEERILSSVGIRLLRHIRRRHARLFLFKHPCKLSGRLRLPCCLRRLFTHSRC